MVATQRMHIMSRVWKINQSDTHNGNVYDGFDFNATHAMRVCRHTSDLWSCSILNDTDWVVENDTWYFFRVEHKGTEVRFWLNNTLFWYGNDSTLTNGSIGLWVEYYSNAQQMRVDDLKVYSTTGMNFYNSSVATSLGNQEYVTDNWSNVTKVLNTTVGAVVQWRVYANDTVDNWNASTIFSLTTVDGEAPRYFDNSTNNTKTGKPTLFSMRWTDNINLDGYIFSFDNGTGTFVNDSWADFESEWPFGDSQRSVVTLEETTLYKIYGENSSTGTPRYVADIEKSGSYMDGAEIYLKVFDYELPFWGTQRRLYLRNTSNQYGVVDFSTAQSQVIESGPVRVSLRFENFTSDFCWISPEAICANFSSNLYAYPRNYLMKYYIEGNYTESHTAGWSLPFYMHEVGLPRAFQVFAGYHKDGAYYKATTASESIGNYQGNVSFMYNTSGHNKTVGFFSTTSSPIQEGGWSLSIPAGYFMMLGTSWNYGNAYSFGWGTFFAESGLRSIEDNETAWKGLEPQWFDFYYPAEISNATGIYLGRDNETMAYNFTASGEKVNFNFSTGSYNRSYPILQIKDLSVVSAVKEHVWWRDVTGGAKAWKKLENGTHFLIQEGNASYFGYNYVLLSLNASFPTGKTYEFWISNSSDPIGDQAWSNATKVINSTVGALIRWRVYANDTAGNWNASEVFWFYAWKDGYISVDLVPSSVLRGQLVNASGEAKYKDDLEPINYSIVTVIMDGQTECTENTTASGEYGCQFTAPRRNKYYTVVVQVRDSKTGRLFSNVTSLRVTGYTYGEEEEEKPPNVGCYEVPMIVQDEGGYVSKANVRICVWR